MVTQPLLFKHCIPLATATACGPDRANESYLLALNRTTGKWTILVSAAGARRTACKLGTEDRAKTAEQKGKQERDWGQVSISSSSTTSHAAGLLSYVSYKFSFGRLVLV